MKAGVFLAVCVAFAAAKQPVPSPERAPALKRRVATRAAPATAGSRVRPPKQPPSALSGDQSLLAARAPTQVRRPSFLWAVVHGWLYMFSIALAAGNLPFLVREVVNPPGVLSATPKSIKVSGDIEALDKLLTFIGVGRLTGLSDVKGRLALIQWSAFGFGLTNMLQARAAALPIVRTSAAATPHPTSPASARRRPSARRPRSRRCTSPTRSTASRRACSPSARRTSPTSRRPSAA